MESLIVAFFIVVAIIVVAGFVFWLIQQPAPPAPKQTLIYGLWAIVVLVCLYVLYKGIIGANWNLP
jgi:hypothetical protein